MKETAEYSIASGKGGISVEMGDGDLSEAVSGNNKVAFELNTDELPEEGDEGAETTDETAGGDDASQDDTSDGDAEGDDSSEELAAFDPEDPEVVAKYDSKYLTEGGDIDAEGALSAEFFANAEKGVEGLNDSTYEYLAAKGISKATVKKIEAMAQTQKDAETQGTQGQDFKLFEAAGGAESLQKALAWGKAGGYTADQQKRFNDITKGKDLNAKLDAVEALMARYNKANPVQKPKVPARDATKGQGKTAPGVKPFKDRSEMRQVRDSLRDNDTAGWAAYNARLKVSKNL